MGTAHRNQSRRPLLMSAKSTYSARPVGICARLSERQPKSPLGIRLGQRAYCAVRAVGSFITSSPVKMHVTAVAAPQDDGSFFQRGSAADRSWFVIASFSSAYLRKTLSVSVSTSAISRSTSGTGSSKTSSSTRLSSAEGHTIGTDTHVGGHECQDPHGGRKEYPL